MFDLNGLSGSMHGWPGLALEYASVAVPMAYSVIRERAPIGKILRSPLLAVPVTAAVGIGMSFLAPAAESLGLSADGAPQLLLGLGLSGSVGYISGKVLARSDSQPSVHRRGAVVTEPRQGSVRMADASGDSDYGVARARAPGHRRASKSAAITLAGIPLSLQDETKHFKLIGTTGTGKSTAIREILRGALKRGDRAIIADPDYGYTNRFYDAARGDRILNPFDAASVKWDLFGEIQNPYDIDQLARSLIVDQGNGDRSWGDYSRTFFTSVMRQMHSAGDTSLGELNRLLVQADAEELRILVRGTPAQPFLQESNSRMFDSIRSVTSSAVRPLEYIARQETQPFSIRRWIQQEEAGVAGDTPVRGRGGAAAESNRDPRGGVLFIPYRAGQIAALRSTVSAWMRIAIFEAMNQPEGDQRLWFVVDELDALGQIDGLKDALARLRKFGGRCVLGFQSIAQVSSTYGAGDAQTIVENCGNSLILRCAASEHGGTSHFASRLIGQREVIRTATSRSRRPTDWLWSKTRSEHFSIEPAVLDSEIEQLPDLAGYLKLASSPEWWKVRLPVERAAAHSAGAATSTSVVSQIQTRALRAWNAFRGRPPESTAGVANSAAHGQAVVPTRGSRPPSEAEPD